MNKNYLRKVGSTLLFSALLVSSCSDEKEPLNRQYNAAHKLTFSASTVEVFQEIENSARSGADAVAKTTAQVTEIAGMVNAQGEQLYLHTFTADSIEMPQETISASRATPITKATMYDEVGVLGFEYDKNSSWATVATTVAPNWYNEKAVKSGNIWSSNSVSWQAGKKYTLFAYAPFNGEGITLSEKTAKGSPTISYTVPTAVGKQKDLLVSHKEDINSDDMLKGGENKLLFKHALTAVKFVSGSRMLGGTIKKVSLIGVNNKGVYNMQTETWSNLEGTATFSQTLNVQASSIPNTAITTEEQTFMMLPQTLTGGAKVEIIYTDSLTNTERTLIAPIQGTWKRGKTVTYKISTSSMTVEPVLEVTPTPVFTYEGGTKTYSVTSHVKVIDKHGVVASNSTPWKATFSTDGGKTWKEEKPDWLTAFTTTDVGGSTAKIYNATVQAQEVKKSNTILSTTPPVEGVYDLSTNGGKTPMNTANCYVVNASGKYKLPLVYGNAIKDGRTNEPAFVSKQTGSNVLSVFHNHLDKGIVYPYIYQNADCTPYDCKLVWQDAPSLISNVKLSDDKKFLEFTVAQGTIEQGNAIVAVIGAEHKIMWSWHIWVTDYVLGTDLLSVNNLGVKSEFIPLNLGWCDVDKRVYAQRSVLVRITQEQTGLSKEFTVFQRNKTFFSLSGNAPYYQWGRKDPIPPSNGADGDKKLYYDDPAYTYVGLNGEKSIGYTIQHPYVLINIGATIGKSNGWYKFPNFLAIYKAMYNLWCSDQKEQRETHIYQLSKRYMTLLL